MIIVNQNGITISVIGKDGGVIYNAVMEEYNRYIKEIASLAKKAEAAKTDLEYDRYADELKEAEDEFRGYRKALTLLGFEIDKPFPVTDKKTLK